MFHPGICCISLRHLVSNWEWSHMACYKWLDNTSCGHEVSLLETTTLQEITTFWCHENPRKAMAFLNITGGHDIWRPVTLSMLYQIIFFLILIQRTKWDLQLSCFKVYQIQILTCCKSSWNTLTWTLKND